MLSPLLIQDSTGSPGHSNQASRRNKRNPTGKEEFTIAMKRIKYLVINLTKDIKTYTWKIMTLKKEIEEDTHKWKYIPCSWIERT